MYSKDLSRKSGLPVQCETCPEDQGRAAPTRQRLSRAVLFVDKEVSALNQTYYVRSVRTICGS